MWSPMPVAAGPPPDRGAGPPAWRCAVGAALIVYGLFNSYLYAKFTPVYMAAECGNQTATLDRLNLGRTISVRLGIEVSCWNPNGYEVSIASSQPGGVWMLDDRRLSIGSLALVAGSRLPERGPGAIRAEMDAELSEEGSARLLPRLLADAEVPLFLELRFAVKVDVNFGLLGFATTVPFTKRCGMGLAGVLTDTAESRLGPLVCRDSFAEVAEAILAARGAAPGRMRFTGAQMDPDRIRLGEEVKNVSTIGMMLLCYPLGLLLLWPWLDYLFGLMPCAAAAGGPAAEADPARAWMMYTKVSEFAAPEGAGGGRMAHLVGSFLGPPALGYGPPPIDERPLSWAAAAAARWTSVVDHVAAFLSCGMRQAPMLVVASVPSCGRRMP